MKNILLASLIGLTMAQSAPAFADPPPWAPAHGWRAHQRGYEPRYQRTDNGIRYWRGENGRTYCRRPNGTVGLLIGGVAGALIGRSIDNHGDRAVGTVLGAAGGALVGRAIARSDARCD